MTQQSNNQKKDIAGKLKQLIVAYLVVYLLIFLLLFYLFGVNGISTFFLVIALHFAFGFFPGQRIDKQVNRDHAVGISNRVYFFVDGDRGFMPWFPTLWPMKPIVLPYPTKWSLYSNEPHPEKNSMGKEITYEPGKEVIGKINLSVDIASDYSNKIRKVSRFVFDVSVDLPISGLSFHIVLPTLFIIKEPMLTLDLEGNMLSFALGEVRDAIDPWFTEVEKKWHKEWLKTCAEFERKAEEKKSKLKEGEEIEPDELPSFSMKVIQEMESLRIDILQGIMIPFRDEKGGKRKLPFRTYLEEQKFRKYGFKFGELSLNLGYGQAVIDIQKERRNQQVEKEKRNTAVNVEKKKVVERITQINNSVTDKKSKENLWVIDQKIMRQIFAGQVSMNRAFKAEFLVLGEGYGKATQDAVGTLGAIKYVNKTKKVTEDGTQQPVLAE